MTILSLWAWSCNTELLITNSNPEFKMIAVDSLIDPWKDDKFSLKDSTDLPKNFELVQIDYNSVSLLETLDKYKWNIDLILMNFPHSNELYFPDLYDNGKKNEKLIKDIYELLDNWWKFIISSERTDNEKSKKAFIKQREIHESYIQKAANFDYLNIYSDVNKKLKLFKEKIESDVLEKINIAWKELELHSKKWVSYNLFRELYDIKTLILTKK